MLSNPKSFEVIRRKDIIGNIACSCRTYTCSPFGFCVQRGVLHQVYCSINSLHPEADTAAPTRLTWAEEEQLIRRLYALQSSTCMPGACRE